MVYLYYKSTGKLLNVTHSAFRVMKMAIVHDLAECIVGDITPFCGVSVEEKHAREEAAITGLCKDLPEDIGSELVNLWKVS